MSLNLSDPGVNWKDLASRWRPIPKGSGYVAGLIAITFAVVIMPLLYLGIIGGVGAAIRWYAVNGAHWFGSGRGRTSLISGVMYVVPMIAGAAVILFLLKPLLAPRGREGDSITLEAFEEPRLHNFVDGVCGVIGAPTPKQIRIDCDVNASAGFRRGILSLFSRGDLVLTIGLPLASGLTKRQLAGVIAHELGHFAQGTGMRLTYVASTIIHWFLRAAFERDAWDQKLDELAHNPDIYIQIIAMAAKLAIWLARLVIRAIAIIGMVLCSFMLRQMEYDADRYEVQLAGSDDYAKASRRIGRLSAAMPQAMEDCRRHFMRSNQLPDDFPAVVADHARRLAPEVQDELDRLASIDPGAFASHPSTASRIKAAADLAMPGLYTDESPASELFGDFASASRKATYGYFRGVLRGDLGSATFVPAAPWLKSGGGGSAGPGSSARAGGAPGTGGGANGDADPATAYLGFEIPTWRPLEIPLSKVPDVSDAKAVVQRLKAAREALKPLAQAAAAKSVAYRAAAEKTVKWEQARSLMDAGLDVDFKGLGLQRTSRAGVSEQLDKLTYEASDSAAVFDEAAEAAGKRVAAALTMLGAPGIEKVVPDAAERRKHVNRLLVAFSAVREMMPLARSVRSQMAVAGGIVRTIKNKKSYEKAKGLIRPLSDQVRDDLDSARRIGGGAPDPHAPEDMPANLGETLVGASPGWREIGEILHYGDAFVDRFTDCLRRTMMDLVSQAEQVERALASAAAAKKPAASG